MTVGVRVIADDLCLQTVEADGKVCTAEPAVELPLSQAYFVY